MALFIFWSFYSSIHSTISCESGLVVEPIEATHLPFSSIRNFVQDTVFVDSCTKFPVDSGLLRFTQIRFPVIQFHIFPYPSHCLWIYILRAFRNFFIFRREIKSFFLFVSDIQTHHLFFEIRKIFLNDVFHLFICHAFLPRVIGQCHIR